MASWNKITAGDTLYDVRRSTGFRRGVDVWPVKVVSMDSVTETAVIEWNGDWPRTCNRKQLEKYRVKRPGSDKAVARKTFVDGQDVEVCVRNGLGKSWCPAKCRAVVRSVLPVLHPLDRHHAPRRRDRPRPLHLGEHHVPPHHSLDRHRGGRVRHRAPTRQADRRGVVKGLDDGPDGLNEAAFDRALGGGRKRAARKQKASPVVFEMNSISLEDWTPGHPEERWCAVDVVERYEWDGRTRLRVRLLEGPEAGRVVSGLSESNIRIRTARKVTP